MKKILATLLFLAPMSVSAITREEFQARYPAQLSKFSGEQDNIAAQAALLTQQDSTPLYVEMLLQKIDSLSLD